MVPGQVELLQAMYQPALLIDAADRITAANDGATGLLGGGLVGRNYVLALRQPSLIEAIEAVHHRAPTARARYLARREGVDSTWQAHASRAGEMILVSFEDLSAAEDADQMRRDFVANVSHELKTPLTAIIGFIETLRGPAKDDATARDRFLGTMAQEAMRMNRLVEDLLALSRVEANERVRPREEVDAATILASVVRVLSGQALDRGIEITCHKPDPPVTLRGDADQLRQVFANLLENAIKYGGKKVTLSLTEHATLDDLRRPGIVVSIKDDGPGIDPIHLPRLTERFYRVDSHRSREVGGTGLGLAIVKHIVSRHRGRLRIASIPGQGTTFTVSLPREA